MLTKSSRLEDDGLMPSKRHEHPVRGDERLLERLAAEKPEFIVEDATESVPLPPVDSEESQVFIAAAERAFVDLNERRTRNGHDESAPAESAQPEVDQ
jgi:hypothetical protein